MARSGTLTLPDTSAWVEYLRGTGSAVHLALRDLVAASAALETTGPVLMEVLSGATDDAEEGRLRSLLHTRCELVAVDQEDFEHAARLHRVCRGRGETVRKRLDCLIAAVAIRRDAEVLHADRDFDVLARHTPLRVADV